MSTISAYTGDGSTTQFDLTFSYRNSSTVIASVGGVETAAFTFINPSRIEFTTAPAAGAEVKIFRRTPVAEAEVTFNDGAIVRGDDLNAAIAQSREATEEVASEITSLSSGALRSPLGESLSSLPPAASRAGKYVAFDDDGNPVATTGTDGLGGALDVVLTGPAGAAHLGLRAPGTGAVLRNPAAKLNEIISVADYGALPGASAAVNTDAFAKASARIEALGGGTLLIPPGTYQVGVQSFGTTGTSGLVGAYSPDDILRIENCSAPVEIIGYGAKLVCAGGLKFGSFDPETGAVYNPGTLPFTDQSYRATPYFAMIYVAGNSSVSIRGLELDGNLAAHIVGGAWNDTGRQIPCYGIFASANDKLTVDDVYTHDHALDGIEIGFPGLTTATRKKPHLLSHVVSEYNARQGLSWTGGNSLTTIGCRFAKTGRRVNTSLGAVLSSAPGAGIDIEAESAVCRNGLFLDTEFDDNAGVGAASHSASDAADFTAIGCKFIGTTTWALWPSNPGWKLRDCLIAGGVTNPYDDATSRERSAQFHNCNFTAGLSQSASGTLFRNNYRVAEINGEYVLFDRCRFADDGGSGGLGLFYASGGTYRDCSFVQTGGGTIVNRGRFEGETTITRGGGTHDLGGSEVVGTLTLDGTSYGWSKNLDFQATWGVSVDGVKVLGGRQAAIGDAATAAAAPTQAEFNALVSKFNLLLDRLGTAGHGLTSD